GDGITHRTLPGTYHPKAAYFTRGTSHDERALYSEDNVNFRKLMDRLVRKYKSSKKYLPQPIVHGEGQIGFVAYGTSDPALKELQVQLSAVGLKTAYMRIRALPLVDEIKAFISQRKITYIVEQNRDAQLYHILLSEWPELHTKVQSITQYDGLPLSADYLNSAFNQHQVQL
ncbi:MAG: hypothetical protein KDD40_13165, partial [Bdellovibrionales bacterium]|nr:hypothetical protein [Bdellovibrionales bacterium]